MSHVIEPAASGRAKCRGCDQKIAKDELRFGEVTENPFGEGDRTLWFHPVCGAYKRPEPFMEAMANALAADGSVAELEAIESPAPEGETIAWLRDQARLGLDHRRLPRIDSCGRAPTGRARCRSCRELIAKDSWRIGLVYYEEGYFNPSGYIHVGCWRDYLGGSDGGASDEAGSGDDDGSGDEGGDSGGDDASSGGAPEPLDPAVVLMRLAHFSPELAAAELAELDDELKST